MSGLDLKSFKKVASGKEYTVMRSDKGHEIKIAHAGLSAHRKAQLDNLPVHLAEGGDGTANDSLGVDTSLPTPQMPQVNTPAPQAPTMVNQAQQQVGSANPYNPTLQSPEYQKYDSEAMKYAQDLANGHITPKTYGDLFAEKSTLGKIGTVFGLLLGGAGSGLAHQPNAALEMMNKELQRDFDAQKQSKENAQNFLRINQQNELQKAQIPKLLAEGKLTQAEAQNMRQQAMLNADTHTMNLMKISAMHSLGLGNEKLPPGSPARMQADQTLNGVGQATQASIQQGNADAAEQSFRNRQQALTMVGMGDISKLQQDTHVPGFGDASVSVPGDVRQELIAKQDYDQAAKNYIDFAKQHQANWANLNPAQRQAIAKQGAVLGAELQGKYRMKTHGGVYKQGEQEYIQKIIPDNAVSWASSFNQIPKVEQTIKDNNADISTLSRGYGSSGPTPKEAPKAEAQKTKWYNGKQYKRGPKGESIPVN